MITIVEFENKMVSEQREIKDLENILTENENQIGLARHLKYKAKTMIENAGILELTEIELELAKKTLKILEYMGESLEAQHSLTMDYLRRHQKTVEELRAVGFLIKSGVDGLFDEAVKLVRG